MKSLKIGEIETFRSSSRHSAHDRRRLPAAGRARRGRRSKPADAGGWQLAKFPIDPRIARMIVAAKQENCLAEVLIIASALTVQDPRERPYERAEAADRAHQASRTSARTFLPISSCGRSSRTC